MATTKKTKRKTRKPRDSEIHFYKKVEPYSSPFVKKIILGIIFASILFVLIDLFLLTVFTEERITKYYIAELASDYYEDYFYEGVINSDSFKESGSNLESAMKDYGKYGLPTIALKDLITHENQNTAPHANYILERCDDTATTVKFLPYSPYSKTDYNVEYTYACNF